MVNNIQKRLDLIKQANILFNSSLSHEKQNKAYCKMINFRRRLNKKKFALSANPAAALYGESQAGKSYLVSALLSNNGQPFCILDGDGRSYDFKKEINPRGNEMESTSIVTRFSTKYQCKNKKYPIIVKLLSPADLVLIMCEAYYHNLNVNKSFSFEELKDEINSLEEKYSNMDKCQKLIIEDDIFDMEDYFNDNFSTLVYNNIKEIQLFYRISQFIAKVPTEEWGIVFSLFWNSNPQLTRLFNDLIEQYRALDFVDTIYLPLEAVLRKKGTLLDVNRLDEIYGRHEGEETEYTDQTSIYLECDKGTSRTFMFSKPYLCALTAELIFILPQNIIQKKPFLEHTDLLDFPGTRRNDNTNENNITDKSLTILLRRGKVDYLFNKYSINECINTLLFCQNHKQSTQSVMPEKLNRWINNMVGKTPEEREQFKSPISPLFVISTWFNKDLQFKFNEDRLGEVQSLNERWNQRFQKTLEKEIIKADTYLWFTNWTTSNRDFQNIFLLRDFDKSSEMEDQIYRGYNQTKEGEEKKEKEEIKPKDYPTFREDLKKSFINYEFVKRHFANPMESWEEAAGINKDGTQLIINKLTIAANSINTARNNKTLTELKGISRDIVAELLNYYHSNDKDAELQKAKSIAGDIQLKLDMAFSADGIKQYGEMMKELMLDEGSVLELYRKKVDDIGYRDLINLDIYSTYRMQIPVLKDDTPESYFERLCKHYEKTSAEQKKQFRIELSRNGIDIEKLIHGNPDLIKNNAQQLAEVLIKYWIASFDYENIHKKPTLQKILEQDNSSSLQDIVEMYQKLFQKLEIDKKIAQKIRKYVDGHNKTDLPYEIIADISAELLNKCINTVGIEYFDKTELNDLYQINEKNNLGLVFEKDATPIRNSVEELFYRIEHWSEIISSHPEEMKTLSNYRNYLAWYNRLKIGFIAVCDIPNYDITANNQLGILIEKCKNINY